MVRFLGKGGFGEVWLAKNHDNPPSDDVAIKLPRDDQINLEAVKDEIFNWILSGKHKNILPIIECETFGNQIAIVSEFAPDGSLQNLLEKQGSLSVTDAAEITIGILDGLAHLHNRQIIHRDLKPDNVLLQNRIPRLTDFGISRAMQMDSNSPYPKGSPYYMAPEAFERKRDAQTDIWSVGVILYQLLTGNLPFPEKEFAEFYGAIKERDPKPLPESIPDGLKNIVTKALAKVLTMRYQTAIEMREDLRKVLDNVSFHQIDSTEVFDRPIIPERVDAHITTEDGMTADEADQETIEDERPTDHLTTTLETQPQDSVLTRVKEKENESVDTKLVLKEAEMAKQDQPTGNERLIKIEKIKKEKKELEIEIASLRKEISEIEVDEERQRELDETQKLREAQRLQARNNIRNYGLGIGGGIIGITLLLIWMNVGSTVSLSNSNSANNTADKSANADSNGSIFANKAANTASSSSSETFKNSIGMEFVKIPAGLFMMGSSDTGNNEKPVHEVTISKDFWMGKTEVTQGQWKAVMGNNPSQFKDCGDNCPVENVSWDDVQEFIKKLNVKGEGTYRLPTEAEWEYACPVVTTREYSGKNLYEIAWYASNSDSKTHPVGQKKANVFGLYDMFGNVSEWTADWYGTYSIVNTTDPMGASSGSNRVHRGDSWITPGWFLRKMSRQSSAPSFRRDNLGFRTVGSRQ